MTRHSASRSATASFAVGRSTAFSGTRAIPLNKKQTDPSLGISVQSYMDVCIVLYDTSYTRLYQWRKTPSGPRCVRSSCTCVLRYTTCTLRLQTTDHLPFLLLPASSAVRFCVAGIVAISHRRNQAIPLLTVYYQYILYLFASHYSHRNIFTPPPLAMKCMHAYLVYKNV